MKRSSYHHLYNTARWKRRRRQQLSSQPLCAFHLAMGISVPATVADHVEPHKGDELKFYQGELQSLCKRCHDSAKQSQERHGYHSMTDADGFPLDPAHPWNK